MEQGWVYILVNPSMPGLVKVGQTAGLPQDRAAELSRHTGVATPFVLVFEQAFANCVTAERAIHAMLDARGMRFNPNREFFRGPIPDVIRILLDYAQKAGDMMSVPPGRSGQDWQRQGDRHLFGEGDALQDIGEAMRCYQLGASRGSIIAYERLGAITGQMQSEARSPAGGGRNRAMGYLKEGVRLGNYYCHCEIAWIAAEEGHTANFMKAWDLFFVQRARAFLSEAEFDEDRYIATLQRYVLTCFRLGIVPSHIPELTLDAEALVQALTKTHEAFRSVPGAPRDLTPALRWCYRMLLRRPHPGDRPWQLLAWLPRRRRLAHG